MTLKAAAGGFVIFLLSVPVIQGQDDWGVTYTSTEICALKGSTVNIPCTFTYPSTGSDNVEKRSWIARGSNGAPMDVTTDPHYAGRVEYPFHENDCTLRIKDLRESDSAEYKFRFMTDGPDRAFTGSPGVFLSVTDLWVQVGRSQARAELRCHSRCNVTDDSSYVWYKNGKKVAEEKSTYRVSFDDKNKYSCAVGGHKKYCSPPVYAPKLPSVSVI
ncbi:uncharacterized protein LOC116401454 [Anarrhichthys ocellatus]|uniref:uncharacterized protein LOC116401454 n=1 Tax=Anarrhichthys ocellatus TaxID=433405 RepID=UPI0012ED476B|nr:uncharacterized protein LOC116401454 [Anarrhichthys ocellatus]